MLRWGPEGKDDFWTALAHGDVDTPELRAMTLLESVCDEYRFSLYAVTAEMPARGNMTGTMYVIQKKGGVIELDEHGTPCGHWCISIGPHSPVPGTDNVVVLKAMLEGEEDEFRRIGNRSGFHGAQVQATVGIVDPFAAGLIPKEWQKHAHALRDRTGTLPDLFELGGLIAVLEQEQREVEENAMLRQARKVGQMNREADQWIDPSRIKAQWFGMQMDDGFLDELRRRGLADVPQERGLDLYDGAEAREDLDYLQRVHAREDRAFLGGPVAGREDNETARLRAAIEREVLRELQGAGGDEGHRGILLRDGTAMYWDQREAQDVQLRTGIVVADEIRRMNEEGYSAEMIRYGMLEIFGVHQVWEGGPIRPDGGITPYLTAANVGVNNAGTIGNWQYIYGQQYAGQQYPEPVMRWQNGEWIYV
jgi:hypothetical protein